MDQGKNEQTPQPVIPQTTGEESPSSVGTMPPVTAEPSPSHRGGLGGWLKDTFLFQKNPGGHPDTQPAQAPATESVAPPAPVPATEHVVSEWQEVTQVAVPATETSGSHAVTAPEETTDPLPKPSPEPQSLTPEPPFSFDSAAAGTDTLASHNADQTTLPPRFETVQVDENPAVPPAPEVNDETLPEAPPPALEGTPVPAAEPISISTAGPKPEATEIPTKATVEPVDASSLTFMTRETPAETTHGPAPLAAADPTPVTAFSPQETTPPPPATPGKTETIDNAPVDPNSSGGTTIKYA